jgi:hypothetical protein
MFVGAAAHWHRRQRAAFDRQAVIFEIIQQAAV